ncbi:hypothetical protein N9N67_11445, partial [Bacteriovoracaceae bacterium]|nr:hypothetical protein [Bacteriovoracaceae bacterium]
MKYLTITALLFTINSFGQGSPGPVPTSGPYPIATSINSVMEQQVWLDSTTTLSQQVNAVTQDALQIQTTVLPPVPSGGDLNVYTSPGTPFVSLSPGPTSTSSSTSSTSSSSGDIPSSEDMIVWVADQAQTLTFLFQPGNGEAYFDTTCVNEATGRGWSNASSAKALVNDTNTNCKEAFLVQTTAKVFTPDSTVPGHP